MNQSFVIVAGIALATLGLEVLTAGAARECLATA